MRYLLLVLCLAPAAARASAPDWVKTEGKSSVYPEARFFTGFGEAMLSADKDEAQCKELARDGAKRRLIERVRVTVKAAGLSKEEEKNGDLSQYVSAVTESVSALDLKGLKLDPYFDEKKSLCYALASVEKAELAKLYASESENFGVQAARFAAAGKAAEEKGDRTAALNDFLSARQNRREYLDARAVAELAGGVSSEASPHPGAAGLPSDAELGQAIDRLAAKPVESVDDAAWALAYFLKAQADLPEGKVLSQPFTFRDTRMGSPFSRYFNQLLEGKLVDTAKWTVVEQKNDVTPKSGDLARDFASASGADYVLTGSYWPQNKSLRLIARLRRVSNGKIAASAEVQAPAAAMTAAKLDIKPENYQNALMDQKLFGVGELQGGGLSLEAWTNKGADGLLFTRGEKMRVFVRMNLPGYVRLIYHLADGKRALLLENYFLDASKVNTAYELPQEFECDAPFGAETLQAFASTEKFDALETKAVDGYDILAQDLKEALVRSRGMKAAKPGLQKAETRLVLTTMDR